MKWYKFIRQREIRQSMFGIPATRQMCCKRGLCIKRNLQQRITEANYFCDEWVERDVHTHKRDLQKKRNHGRELLLRTWCTINESKESCICTKETLERDPRTFSAQFHSVFSQKRTTEENYFWQYNEWVKRDVCTHKKDLQKETQELSRRNFTVSLEMSKETCADQKYEKGTTK